MLTPQAINGRVATKEDVESGNAIFYIPDHRSVPYSLGKPLPLRAVITKSNLGKGFPATGTTVQIVQAEQDDKNVLLGYVYHGESGVCSIQDVSIDDSFHTWNSWCNGTLAAFLLLICISFFWIRYCRSQRPHP